MIKEHLIHAGLNSTEAEIYLTLYEYRRLSPASITQLTGIKRTTVYASADELVKKGLANIEHGKNRRFYVVDSSESLARYIALQEKNLQRKKEAVNDAIKELNEIPRSRAIPTPKVRIVTETNIESFLYTQTPLWEESMKKTKEEVWWGFQDTSFVENEDFRKWILWYWKRAPRKIKLKLFSNNAEIEKDKKLKRIKRRMIRFWDAHSPITGTQWILGDYIVSIVVNEKSSYLIQTYDSIMAHNLRELYKKLWKDFEEK